MKNLSSLFGKDNLDEIVFSNRNKAYGAYVLRNEYSNQLTKAVFIGVTFFASLSIIPLVISAFSTETIINDTVINDPRILVTVDVPDPPKPQPAATIPPDIKTVASPIFKPVREVKKDTPIPTKKDFEGAAIGSETKDGKETDIPSVPPVIKAGPPAFVPTAPPAKPVDDPNKLINQNEADVAADFKGGINAFRQKVANGFDTESVSQEGMVSGVITFVVEIDGSISDIKITGPSAEFNKEAQRTVKSIKTKWTPAQLKGKAVRSSFRMPISMKIE
ncbi:energy transducer TonB [Epilithonimonas xixisoli]|uniref:Protein TonB n=1 Tax=Epilithonimonas xixisoli TaxID=1476462 RepID=A0A4R8I916_9FLAO|nr:energy transducer TonB [Epilithonimonas xixisoli]TDX85980.1 protein TonB [Epilithonimonas xixisoli]